MDSNLDSHNEASELAATTAHSPPARTSTARKLPNRSDIGIYRLQHGLTGEAIRAVCWPSVATAEDAGIGDWSRPLVGNGISLYIRTESHGDDCGTALPAARCACLPGGSEAGDGRAEH